MDVQGPEVDSYGLPPGRHGRWHDLHHLPRPLAAAGDCKAPHVAHFYCAPYWVTCYAPCARMPPLMIHIGTRNQSFTAPCLQIGAIVDDGGRAAGAGLVWAAGSQGS